MKSLGRQSLPSILAEEIIKSIARGEWVDALPGYRTLCDAFQVSQHTCKTALKILEADGVIAAAEVGRRRRILKKKHPSKSHSMSLLIIEDALLPMEDEEARLLGRIAEFCLKRGGRVHRVGGDLRRWKNPGKILRAWIDDHSSTHLLFHTPPLAWSDAVIEIGIPCYYIGGEIRKKYLLNGQAPGSGHDGGLSLAKVLEEAKKQGHKQVMIPSLYGQTSLRDHRLKHFRSVYGDVLSPSECEESIPIFSESDPESWLHDWKREFSKRKVSLVIVTSVTQLLSLYGYCQMNGIAIEQDLSVVVIGGDRLLKWITPRPTYLELPLDETLLQFKRWIRNGCAPQKYHFFELRWNSGKTFRPS